MERNKKTKRRRTNEEEEGASNSSSSRWLLPPQLRISLAMTSTTTNAGSCRVNTASSGKA
jgi:hypothetical protein